MKSSLLRVFLCLLLVFPAQIIIADSPPKFIASDVKLNAPVSRLQTIQTINTAMGWWEDYRINSSPNFWSKLWLRFKRFLGYLSFDLEYLTKVSRSPNSRDIFLANRWGMILEEKQSGQKVTGWQLLELESQALSKALSESGIPRTMTDEVANIRAELVLMSRSINDSYNPVIKEGIIKKPKRQFKPDNAWVYYIFATQHGLLAGDPNLSPGQLLDKPLTGRDLENYIEKMIALLKQMADDLK